MKGDAAGATPSGGPTMAFLSNASTPAARHSPFAEFQASPARNGRVPVPAGPESHAPRRAAASSRARAASAEPPGVPGRRRRSRSPHAAPSAFHVHDGASEGRATSAVKLLETNLEELTARVWAQEASREWAEDNAKRLDAIEAQVRQQTNEAKEYAFNKCLESDKQLRLDLDKTIPDMLASSRIR